MFTQILLYKFNTINVSFGTKLHVYNAHGFHIGACNRFVLVSLYRNLDRYCSPFKIYLYPLRYTGYIVKSIEIRFIKAHHRIITLLFF